MAREPIRNTPATQKALIDSLPTTRIPTTNTDKFALPAHAIIPGVTREWKAHTVVGEVQIAAEADYRQQGWIPVTTDQIPQLMPPGTPDDTPIERDGMWLWQRRAELTEQSRAEETHRAMMQKQMKTQQLSQTPDGHAARKVLAASRSIEPVAVPTADNPL